VRPRCETGRGDPDLSFFEMIALRLRSHSPVAARRPRWLRGARRFDGEKKWLGAAWEEQLPSLVWIAIATGWTRIDGGESQSVRGRRAVRVLML
jgi:hypothetical protein